MYKRQVPATVDVVTVQSYDLIEPLTAPYVYAIGLTQERFPKIAQNISLLSEEERQQLNEATQEGAELQVVTSENLKKTLLGQPDRVDIRRCQGFNQVIGLNRHHIDRSRNRPVLRQLHPR